MKAIKLQRGNVSKDVISYPQDDGKDEGTVTESTGTGDNDEQSTDEYSDVNGNAAGQHNEKSDEKSLSKSDITIHTNAAGQMTNLEKNVMKA